MAELISVRPGEELDMRMLVPYLHTVFPDDGGPWTVRQYAAGHSNLTYLLSSPQRSVVLRRPPMGPVPPRAHDMLRESRFLTALHPLYPWAPNVFAVSDETGPLGVPFFLMEQRTGSLIDRAWGERRGLAPGDGQRISEVMVSRLAALHQVDWEQSPLVEMVKPHGFLERQVTGWVGRYERAKTQEILGVDQLCRWLVDHIPPESGATVIHYDYKLNNVLFRDDLTDLSGVFDWEMATVGDPLADLAVAISYWTESDDHEVLKQAFGELPITVEPGFYSRDQWIQVYAQKTGRDINNFGYYLTFAYFKLAVIIAQIYYRYYKGQTRDPRFRGFGKVTRQLLEVAMEVQTACY